MLEHIEIELQKLRSIKPLVLNLTNYVTMDFMANALLALGAAPIMSVCDRELEELIKIAHSIYINIGTLDEAFIQRSHKAVHLAKLYQKPVVLDPVGAGASLIRTQTAQSLMKEVDIIRGNASEILALAALHGKTLGVEATNTLHEVKDLAIELAQTYDFTVAISGPVDFITDGHQQIEIPYGSALMPLVTGMGCTLTAVIAAFRGIHHNSFKSTEMAMSYFGLCGQLAETFTAYSGTFRSIFIDQLHAANFQKMREI